MRCRRLSIAILLTGLILCALQNTYSFLSFINSRTISTARGDSGTRCSFLAFMRDAGIVQVAVSRFNSSDLALMASFVLAAVRMVNSKQRADTQERARSLETKAATSAKGMALW